MKFEFVKIIDFEGERVGDTDIYLHLGRQGVEMMNIKEEDTSQPLLVIQQEKRLFAFKKIDWTTGNIFYKNLDSEKNTFQM